MSSGCEETMSKQILLRGLDEEEAINIVKLLQQEHDDITILIVEDEPSQGYQAALATLVVAPASLDIEAAKDIVESKPRKFGKPWNQEHRSKKERRG
jgi:hypothetical protein